MCVWVCVCVCVCDFFIYLLDCVVLLYLYSLMGKCVDVGACLCFFFFLVSGNRGGDVLALDYNF